MRHFNQGVRPRGDGRHAGWIAAAGALAADEKHDIPLVILFPEVTFEPDKFLAMVETKVKAYGYCSVVVSEGVRGADGKFLADAGAKDAFGHAHLGGAAPVVANMINNVLGYKTHWAVANYCNAPPATSLPGPMSSRHTRWARPPSNWHLMA